MARDFLPCEHQLIRESAAYTEEEIERLEDLRRASGMAAPEPFDDLPDPITLSKAGRALTEPVRQFWHITEDWFHGVCLALLRWRPRRSGVPRLVDLKEHLDMLRQISRLKEQGYSNYAIGQEVDRTEGDIRHHLKQPEMAGKLAERLYDLKNGVRNAMYSSKLQTSKQRAYIQHLANLLGIPVPIPWLQYSKRQAGGLISKLLSRVNVGTIEGTGVSEGS